MRIDVPETVQRAAPGDWRKVADITAEAFREDPVNRYVFGTEEGIRAAMRVLARDVYVPAGYSYTIGDRGASMWLPPGTRAHVPLLSQVRLALGQVRHGSRGAIRRVLKLGELLDQHHPDTPHMYLFTIGTRAAARGEGVGKALLAPVLAACDRAGVPVYLENSNPANHGFYVAHGFEKTAEFAVGPGGPTMTPMWRAPR